MAFTNLWDNTFPADTELANLIGSNLRQLRVDTQQRMAAISGVDAAKPNFAADAQAASWNGILFFAIDTGRVYQFSNPNWTEVTNSIASGGTTGGSILVTAFDLPNIAAGTWYIGLGIGNIAESVETSGGRSPMPTGGTFQNLYVNVTNVQPASGNMVITLRINGVSQSIAVTIPAGAPAGVYSNTGNSAAFNQGDMCGFQIVNNMTPQAGQYGAPIYGMFLSY